MHKLHTTILILLFLTGSLYCPAQQFTGVSYSATNNKISSKLEGCGLANKKYQSFHGIEISADYKIGYTVSLNINADSTKDFVLVLSPVIQEQGTFNSPCYNKGNNKRLLVVVLSRDSGYFIEAVTENLILNKQKGIEDPFKSIKLYDSGFVVKFYTGDVTRCYYRFYFNTQREHIYLNQAESNCYMYDLTKSKTTKLTYPYADSSYLEHFNVSRYIQVEKAK